MNPLSKHVALGVSLAVLALNWGPVLDAVTYRPLVAQARMILPLGWQSIEAPTADAHIAALLAAQSARQRVAMQDANPVFEAAESGPVLAIPVGLDTEFLSLDTGCFRFARRQITIIVWHFEMATGCL